MTDLKDDLQILRSLRLPYKSTVMAFTAHLYHFHREVFDAISPSLLQQLIYSSLDTEQIALALEKAAKVRNRAERVKIILSIGTGEIAP